MTLLSQIIKVSGGRIRLNETPSPIYIDTIDHHGYVYARANALSQDQREPRQLLYPFSAMWDTIMIKYWYKISHCP